jgi:hypothetical protein
MAKKSTKSKTVNKSAWIRAQPSDAAAAELVKKAKAEGIKLTIAQIYTTRSAAKKAQGTASKRGAKKAASSPLAKPSKKETETVTDSRHQFVALAMRIGTDEAQRLLDAIIDVQTPVGRR